MTKNVMTRGHFAPENRLGANRLSERAAAAQPAFGKAIGANPVMAKLLEGGLEVTAVHNHLLRSEPLPFYMHVGGHGDPVKMAETIRSALAVSKTPLAPPG
jgi:hypothetical protein